MIFSQKEATDHLQALSKASWRRRVERIVALKTKRGEKRVRVIYALVHAEKKIAMRPKKTRLRIARHSDRSEP